MAEIRDGLGGVHMGRDDCCTKIIQDLFKKIKLKKKKKKKKRKERKKERKKFKEEKNT